VWPFVEVCHTPKVIKTNTNAKLYEDWSVQKEREHSNVFLVPSQLDSLHVFIEKESNLNEIVFDPKSSICKLSIRCAMRTKVSLVNSQHLKLKKLCIDTNLCCIVNPQPQFLTRLEVSLCGRVFETKEWQRLIGTQLYPETVVTLIGFTKNSCIKEVLVPEKLEFPVKCTMNHSMIRH